MLSPAMGRGAAMKELLGLPLAELERRCRHNGLSLGGGRETMVARLLDLEEAERRRGYDRDDDMRYGHGHFGKHSRDGDSWSENIAGHRKANLGKEPLGSGKWNRHGEEVIQTYAEVSVAPLSQTLTIPQSELKAISGKKGKSDPVLPVSKWSREDDSSDEENKKGARDLGLSYSSSGSENAGDGHENADEAEVDTEVGVLAHSDSSMNEELRQKLRYLEIVVMEYRESLEERGIRSSEEIEKKVAIHRKRLQSEFGLLDSTEGTNKHSSQRTSMERKERRDDAHDSSRKRHRSQSRSRSPQRKTSNNRDREREGDLDRDRDRRHERDRSHETESERGREHEKSGSRERDDHGKDKTRERDRDRRKRGK